MRNFAILADAAWPWWAIALAVWAVVTLLIYVYYLRIFLRLLSHQPLLVAHLWPASHEGEPCELNTRDGLRLSATWLPSREPTPLGVVVFCHELNGNRWSGMPMIDALRGEGYHVLTFDFRNHGGSDSGQNYTPVPWISVYDLYDVEAAVNYAAARCEEAELNVGLMGLSRGGTAALCWAARDRRVSAVVVESPVPSGLMHTHYYHRFVDIYVPRWLRVWVSSWLREVTLELSRTIWGWLHNCPLVAVHRMAAKVRQPVLIVHGERDGFVPPHLARQLCDYVAGPAELWVVEGARHNGAMDVAPEQYVERLSHFFRQHVHAAGENDRDARGTSNARLSV